MLNASKTDQQQQRGQVDILPKAKGSAELLKSKSFTGSLVMLG